MKFIKVTALAAAMMTTFGAQAELTAMDDAALEAVSGQRGINITLTNGGAGNILVADAAYDDLDGTSTTVGDASAGSLYLMGTTISGTNAGGTMAVTVDVDGTSGTEALVIGVSGLSIANTQIGIGATTTALTAVDFTAGSGNTKTLLRSNMTFNGTVGIRVDAF